MSNGLTRFGFGSQDARDSLFVGCFLGSLREPAGELLIAERLTGFEKGHQSLDLLPRQVVNDLVKSLQVAHDDCTGGHAPWLQYTA